MLELSSDLTQTTLQDEVDNPAAAAGQNRARKPSPAQLTIRETTGVQWSGAMMLVPPSAPRYLLVPDHLAKQLLAFDLLRPSDPGVAVLHGDNAYVISATLSADGGSISLGCQGAGLLVYDTAPLIAAATTLLEAGEVKADDQTAPRGQAPTVGVGPAAGIQFSQDASRLFALWHGEAGVTVHDPWQPDLPVLRKLSFHGPPSHYSNCMLACAAGLLVASAGGGSAGVDNASAEEARLRSLVRLWRLDADGETELRTVSNPDWADSVAISPSGDLIAIGLRNGMVRLLSPLAIDDDATGEPDVYMEPEALGKNSGFPRAHTLCFSHDGSRLVVGRVELDDFTIYDVASAAIVGHFVHPKSQGADATFFPADDVLVTGTTAATQQCVFHRLVPPTSRFEVALSPTASIDSSDVALGGKSGPVVALAAGSHLSVHTTGGKRLLHHEFGEKIFSSLGKFRSAVQLHPDGKCVACILAKKTVVVLSVSDGSELLRVNVGSCFQLWWSPNGALLAIGTTAGAQLFSTNAGFAEAQHVDPQESVLSCVFDSTGVQFATGTMHNVRIWEVATWTPTHTFDLGSIVYALCFSNTGDHIAYQLLEDHQVGLLPLDAASDGEPLMLLSKVNAVSALQFSPDDNFLLCCPSSERDFDQQRMRVLDLGNGTDVGWGDLLRTMALPVTGGTLCGRTLGWTQLSQPQSSVGDTTGDDPNMSQWVLYGAVGNRLVATDIDASLLAIEDNAWTTDQLEFASKHQQEQVGSLVEAAPHCSNIRDAETGETVLHRLAQARRMELLQQWLNVCPDMTPIADRQGLTAVQVAVQLEHIVAAQALSSKLPSSVTSISASLVQQDLSLLSKTHPHLVRPFLQDIEPSVVRTLATFRTELARPVEVCGLPTATLAGSGSDVETASEPKNATEQIPSIWADKCPADSPKTLVAAKVVVLPDLLGDADSSPFHNIVERCNASVFDSKVLELIVQYKWEENVRALRMQSTVAYTCACALGTVAMVFSVTDGNVGTVTFSTTDILQSLVVVIELSSLCVEAFQLAREGVVTYFSGPWNILDVMSSGLLLVASAYHFVRDTDGVRAAGALGVALKCFGLVDYLRSSPATGSLVRMISVILTDMVPFIAVLSFVVLGCTMFLTIQLTSSAESESDSIDGSRDGLLWTLVTVYHMTLGIGQGIDTSTASGLTVSVVTMFTSFVVVVLLNLLIAIMGDSYEKVKESERVEALQERARIVVEMEKRSPKAHRYHRFMHLVEAADSNGTGQEVPWEGVTRRVTDMIRTETSKLEDTLVDITDRQDKLDVKLELLDNKFDVLNSKFDIMLDRLA